MSKIFRVLFQETGKKKLLSPEGSLFEDFLNLVQKESNRKKIEIQDADGYEIPSDKEFQRYIGSKEQPELVVIFPLGSPEDEPIASGSSAGHENGFNDALDFRTLQPPEADAEIVTATDGKTVIILDKSKCRFNVVDIVKNSGRPDRIVESLLMRVQSKNENDIFLETDQRLLTKILGSYLYNEFGKDKNPEPQVFEEMAQSIMAFFPMTKGSDGFGWEAWYDMSTGRGRLWKYSGDSRRKAGVKRKYEKKEKITAPANVDEAEIFMKESEVAESNEGAMIEAFKSSFVVRRKWIEDKKPMVAEIFERYPRYRDLQQAIKLDFNEVAECNLDLFLPKWLTFQEKIIARLPEDVQASIANSESVSEKAEILFLSLPALLPTRPITARSNNARPVHQKDLANLYLQIFPANTVLDRALLDAANKNMKVGLIVIGKQYFLKLETMTIKLKVGCLAEAISHLCASFFVFNFEYPPALKNLYAFFERVFPIPYKKGFVVRNQFVCDFITKLK